MELMISLILEHYLKHQLNVLYVKCGLSARNAVYVKYVAHTAIMMIFIAQLIK